MFQSVKGSNAWQMTRKWTKLVEVEAIQSWSAICRVWPWTLTYQTFLLFISSQGQDMYVYWFSSDSGYRSRRQRRTLQYNH